jgi:hypothetical protein
MIIVFIMTREVGPHPGTVVTVLTLANRNRVAEPMMFGITFFAFHGPVISPIYAVVFIKDVTGGTAKTPKKPGSLGGLFFRVTGKTLAAQQVVHQVGRASNNGGRQR